MLHSCDHEFPIFEVVVNALALVVLVQVGVSLFVQCKFINLKKIKKTLELVKFVISAYLCSQLVHILIHHPCYSFWFPPWHCYQDFKQSWVTCLKVLYVMVVIIVYIYF